MARAPPAGASSELQNTRHLEVGRAAEIVDEQGHGPPETRARRAAPPSVRDLDGEREFDLLDARLAVDAEAEFRLPGFSRSCAC